MSVAEIKDLCKTYPSFRLDRVSFELEPGRITGFIGRNGAGKTTTIKSILNLVHPDSGEIKFFGMDLSENEHEIKKRIGYSTGTVSWYPGKKIREISEVMSRFYGNWDEKACEEYMKLFCLEWNKTPRELSEGMKVKFNLMIALSHKAEVLILDEPTSGLDPFSRDELLDVFTGLKDTGTSVFFSTHVISDIEKCADDILYISGGRIVDSLAKPEFTEKYSETGETLEQTFLRLERGVRHA